MVKAVIFDMDGTMIDTERVSAVLWEKAGEEFGYCIGEEILCRLRGTSREEGRQAMLSYFGAEFPFDQVRARQREMFDARLKQEGIPVKEGLQELLAYLKDHGCRIMLGTAPATPRVNWYMEELGIGGYFDGMICGDMVARCKPDPEIFLTAAEFLHLRPSECMVIEDSFNGIRAAYAGGFLPVMVPDLAEPTPEIESMLYAKCDSLLDVKELLDRMWKEGLQES